MKTNMLLIAGGLLVAGSAGILTATNYTFLSQNQTKIIESEPVTKKQVSMPARNETAKLKAVTKDQSAAPKCVFMTAFEGKGLNEGIQHNIPERVMNSIGDGMEWLLSAQNNDGGWGAGTHSRQDILDPHAVTSDPATTAMSAMAIMRSGSTIYQGPNSKQLKQALTYLLEEVEDADESSLNITNLTGTQPQVKLGQNIDVVLTSQFLGNIVHDIHDDPNLRKRVKNAIAKCVNKISRGQSSNGSQQGNGWAGVLQSSFATSALETAKDAGVAVDEEVLDRSRSFQKNNINVENNQVATESAAGVVLYSVSGSARASAKETAEAKAIIQKAKQEGKIQNEDVNVTNLRKAGLSDDKAMKYNTAYQVNKAAKKMANDDNVLSGFGNNGGEEFLSYLQTGEGMILSRDMDWKTWYNKTSGRLVKIQNNDGSWSGHHCITSPVFCTATCLLILSVNNDIDKLTLQRNQ